MFRLLTGGTSTAIFVCERVIHAEELGDLSGV
jgi:hypothetical protein